MVEMAGNIPEHLMILDAELAGNFVAAIAVLRSAVTTWENIPRDPTSGVAGMRQGNRVLTKEHLEEVVLDPAGFKPFTLDTPFESGFLLQHIEGNLA